MTLTNICNFNTLIAVTKINILSGNENSITGCTKMQTGISKKLKVCEKNT